MGQLLLTAPTEEPITLAEARSYLRISDDDIVDDALLAGLITTARRSAEHRTGRALVTQLWRETLNEWPVDSFIELSRSPLVSVQAISYLDGDGTRQTIDAADYQVVTDALVGAVQPAYGSAGWPTCRETPGSIHVDYTAGYGGASAVPQPIKAWMLLAIGTWYAQREALVTDVSVSELPRAFWEGLLDPYWIPVL